MSGRLRCLLGAGVLLAALQPARLLDAGAGAFWPPRLGQRFPDLQLVDQTGERVRMSDFGGSIILVEYVGMTCPACQAFSGAHEVGGFEGVRPQESLKSIAEYFPLYSGVSLDDDRIVFVQVILYGTTLSAPTARDAARWAEHFDFERSRNEIVLAGTRGLLGKASFDLIPGFQLIDQHFVLRADSTGHEPRHDLYQELLPLVPGLLLQGSGARPGKPPAARRDAVAGAGETGHVHPGVGAADVVTGPTEGKLSVEEAYRAIPHRRTLFDTGAARMTEPEKLFLREFFALVDRAVVERVQMTRWILTQGQVGSGEHRYRGVIKSLEGLSVPRALRGVHRLVIEAVEEQRVFLDQAKTRRHYSEQEIKRHSLVLSSSQKLRRAYAALLRLFANEPRTNQQAFFDYLCALDFI